MAKYPIAVKTNAQTEVALAAREVASVSFPKIIA